MDTLLFWLYFANSVLLIVHEIDSAYWKEWELFKLPGGETGFLIIHFPLLSYLLLGMTALLKNLEISLVFSISIAMIGIIAFFLHSYFMKRDDKRFNSRISRIILINILVISSIQLLTSIYKLLSK